MERQFNPTVFQPDFPHGERAGEGYAPPTEVVVTVMQCKRSTGACVGGKPNVTDRPFTKAKSTEEAVKWARQGPALDGDVIEVREVLVMSDIPPDIQKAAGNPTVRAPIEQRQGA